MQLSNIYFFQYLISSIQGGVCPSDCWSWDDATKLCEINANADCFNLNCDHDRMQIEFASKLFGVKDDVDQSVFGTEHPPTFDTATKEWKMNCELGACGMEVVSEKINSVTNLVYSILITTEMHKIQLGGNNIWVSPVGSTMQFRCAYPASFDISTDSFTVKTAEVNGNTVKFGDLKKGFSLDLYTDKEQQTSSDSGNIYIGAPVYAEMTWFVTTTQQLVNFYIDECHITDSCDDCDIIDSSYSVNMIRDNCYAMALGVQPLGMTNAADKMVQASSKFSFISFTIGDVPRLEMKSAIICKVKLCVLTDTECTGALSQTDDDCDGKSEVEYQYKAFSGTQ